MSGVGIFIPWKTTVLKEHKPVSRYGERYKYWGHGLGLQKEHRNLLNEPEFGCCRQMLSST